MDKHSIPNRITELCQQRGWSYYKLAQKAGFQQANLNSILKGKNLPTLYTISKICEALDISLSDFFKSSFFDNTLVSTTQYQKLWDSLSNSDKEKVLIYMHGLTHTIPKEDFKNDI